MFKGDIVLVILDLVYYDGFIKVWGVDVNLVEVIIIEIVIDLINGYDLVKKVYDVIFLVLFDNGLRVEIIIGRVEVNVIFF